MSLAVCAQHYRGLFYLVVGRRIVQLHHVLSGHVTHVGHGHAHLYHAVILAVKAYRGAVGYLKVGYVPFELGVGKAVAEGVLHHVVVAVLYSPLVFSIGGIPEAHFVGRLVPPVAQVNALAVVGVRYAFIRNVGTAVCVLYIGRIQPVAVGIEIGCVVARTGIHIGGGGRKVIGVRVGKLARRVYVAVKDARYRPCARRAGGCNYKAAVQAGDRVHESQFHNVGGVNEHYYVVIVLAHIFEQRLFLG